MDGRVEQSQRIGLRFSEKMSGFVAEGTSSFEEGEKEGKKRKSSLSFQVTIHIEDMDSFCKLSGRKARLEGTISYKPVGQKLPIRNGEFALFRPDRETGKRHMTYSFRFTGIDRQAYFLYGYKVLYDDPQLIDGIEDMTRLFTRIYKGDSADGIPFASGVLYFPVASLPSMLASFEVTHTSSPFKKFQTISKFFSFCYGEIRDTYLSKFSPIYSTEYENLVLNGKLQCPNG
jgi:cholesterol oxidase